MVNRKQLSRVKRVVVKIGTNVLADNGCNLDIGAIDCIVSQAAGLREAGRQVIIVSSGAITAGMGALKLKCKPRTIPQEQAAAAVGQGLLMSSYTKSFSRYGINTAQMLLTQGDLRDRKRYLNARNTVMALIRRGVVPIVNENDTVAVDELVFGDRFGDNDLLSALVTILSESQLLVMLTSVDGLYGNGKKLISCVESVNPEIESYARAERSCFGKGGMETKIKAAGIVAASGEMAVIANGREKNILEKIFSGSEVGTIFLPGAKKTDSRKRWIAYTLQSRGSLVIDEGAERAIQSGRSLLPGGVTGCKGAFKKGDAVSVVSAGGGELGRGLTNYSSAEIIKILGAQSSEIESILGQKPYDEIIHRDNLTVLKA